MKKQRTTKQTNTNTKTRTQNQHKNKQELKTKTSNRKNKWNNPKHDTTKDNHYKHNKKYIFIYI